MKHKMAESTSKREMVSEEGVPAAKRVRRAVELAQSLAYRLQHSRESTESLVGIAGYVNDSLPAFSSAVIKHRFTDFIVWEIDRVGAVVRLNEIARPATRSEEEQEVHREQEQEQGEHQEEAKPNLRDIILNEVKVKEFEEFVQKGKGNGTAEMFSDVCSTLLFSTTVPAMQLVHTQRNFRSAVDLIFRSHAFLPLPCLLHLSVLLSLLFVGSPPFQFPTLLSIGLLSRSLDRSLLPASHCPPRFSPLGPLFPLLLPPSNLLSLSLWATPPGSPLARPPLSLIGHPARSSLQPIEEKEKRKHFHNVIRTLYDGKLSTEAGEGGVIKITWSSGAGRGESRSSICARKRAGRRAGWLAYKPDISPGSGRGRSTLYPLLFFPCDARVEIETVMSAAQKRPRSRGSASLESSL